ncbi:class I SAM-dependent methyltransferase [Flexivirga alba]|uniref:Class I SAM-dependent methyltransferase n=1 Tax=Flexivirga alba TaxID=702742 RepID=A0ABW2ACC5_9MICO
MANDRSRSFGAVAAAYERYRPEYPDRIAELVQAYAETPVRTALELGAGTGKATNVFARHGISVTASDPDLGMLDELSRRLPEVATVHAPLEKLPVLGPFDLVFAAASLHWTEPAGRWSRIAGLLVPGGVFACFGGAPYLADPELEATVQAAEQPWVIDDSPAGPTDVSEDGMHWPATELVADACFTDVRETVIEQRLELTRDEWIGYLSTVSAYLVLSEEDRAAALAAAHDVLPAAVQLVADLTVHLARRV